MKKRHTYHRYGKVRPQQVPPCVVGQNVLSKYEGIMQRVRVKWREGSTYIVKMYSGEELQIEEKPLLPDW